MAQLKPYNCTDLHALAQLWYASWLSSNPVVFDDDTPERFACLIEENLANGWDLTLAWSDNTLKGFLALRITNAWLDQLFIAPDYQNKGLGLELLTLQKAKCEMAFNSAQHAPTLVPGDSICATASVKLKPGLHPIVGPTL
jgi:GNAT superfamily N-acetyltransferase